MVPPELLISCGMGVLIGMVSALLGLGGGFLYVPLLVILFGVDPRVAVGTSLAVISCTTLSASVGYARQGRVLPKSTACLALPGMACAVLGAFATTFIPSAFMIAVFCIILFLMGIKMLYREFPLVFPLLSGPCWKDVCHGCRPEGRPLNVYPVHLASWGALAGFMSGLTGIGGGIVNVPALTIARIPIHCAVATSAAVILITSLSGTGMHFMLGHISLPFFLAFAPGAVIGAQAGVYLSPKTPSRVLEIAIGTLLIIVTVMLISDVLLG